MSSHRLIASKKAVWNSARRISAGRMNARSLSFTCRTMSSIPPLLKKRELRAKVPIRQPETVDRTSKSSWEKPHVSISAVIAAQRESPSTVSYTEGEVIPITSTLHIVTPEEDAPTGVWPLFRIMVRSHIPNGGHSLVMSL
jgi:hypothetical protein